MTEEEFRDAFEQRWIADGNNSADLEKRPNGEYVFMLPRTAFYFWCAGWRHAMSEQAEG